MTLAELQAGALLIVTDFFLNFRRVQLGALTFQYAIPTAFQYREFAAAGGLISYGPSPLETNRIIGGYAGRILKGEKPADLPVQQATKIELIVNMTTAKALGLTFPTAILVRADEVIE
jgi:ABC-type uncharacterized transport system substrate-binding protein